MAREANGAGSVLIAEDDDCFRQLLVKWAISVDERIAEASREIRCEEGPVHFSIGISEWGPAIESIEVYLEQAVQALYEAKGVAGRRIRGGDRIIFAWKQRSL